MIEKLIDKIGEDKKDNFSTTSNKFKIDLWNFFSDNKFKSKICVEFGTHKGQTTLILSHLFEKVYTINKNEKSFERAKELNSDIQNIIYVPYDLYMHPTDDNPLVTQFPRPWCITDTVDVSAFFIDAGHAYHQIMMDIERALLMDHSDEVYFVFDDYGMKSGVHKAVNKCLMNGIMDIECRIGHDILYNFGGNPERILLWDSEGLICKLNK